MPVPRLTKPADGQLAWATDHALPCARNSWGIWEKTMEKTFGVIMLAVLIVVAILGYHYN
jgi:hypothetical protein